MTYMHAIWWYINDIIYNITVFKVLDSTALTNITTTVVALRNHLHVVLGGGRAGRSTLL